MADRRFGEIPGVREGDLFADRIALSEAGVHRPRQAGISGGARSGADSIVVSGGYVDDEDYGDRIIYTGHGGNDPNTGQQIADQELQRGNRGLAVSADEGLPVRVVRGAKGDPGFSPAAGYRYDGLFSVTRYWPDRGQNGYRIWRFELSKIGDPGQGSTAPEADAASRVTTTVQRIVRNTALGTEVKDIYGHRCQFCGEVVETRAGVYAEAAHIRPVGSPHDGPDALENLLCLCPNCHVRFDRLAVYVDDQHRVISVRTAAVLGNLATKPGHHPSSDHLAYQRDLCLG
jgi:putative restriction endonuclease